MDVITIARALWRHKWASIPVVALTLFGVFYVMVIQSPLYEANANVLVANPPSPPTKAQIAADPGLVRGTSDNPLAKLDNLVVITDLLIQVATSPASKQALAREGVRPGYKVTLDSSFGTPPAIDIVAVGSTAQAAVKSAQLLATGVMRDLYQLQAGQHVAPAYMITSLEYVSPTVATTSLSAAFRELIAVLAGGFVLLLVAVSIAQALEDRRDDTRRQENQLNAGGSAVTLPGPRVSGEARQPQHERKDK